MSNATIAIYGAGAIGCYLGTHLHTRGHPVVFIGRERLQHSLSTTGLTVSNGQGLTRNIPATQLDYRSDAHALNNADIVLLTVKSGDSEQAGHTLRKHIKPGAFVVSLQNGVRNVPVLKQQLPDTQVFAGMVPFNVVYQGGGHFHMASSGTMMIAAHPQVTDLVAAFNNAGLDTEAVANIEAIQWTKLLMNLNNAVNALSGKTLLQQLHDPGYRAVMAKVIAEALQILRAADIQTVRLGKVVPWTLPWILKLPTWAFKRVARAMLKIDAQALSSMHEDLRNHKITEIDYLNGEIVAVAERLQLSAPYNSGIVRQIQQAQRQGQGSPNLSANAIRQHCTPPCGD